MCAVARDGNENMLPIAIAVVDIECKVSWLWFLQLLFKDFGTPQETHWVFISDKQKVQHLYSFSLITVIKFYLIL